MASIHHPLSHKATSKGKEDVGQALSRSAAGIDICPGSGPQHAPHPISVDPGPAASSKPSLAKKSDTSKQEKTKTKKKKKKNAIDDLFDGLL
jgi:hypothetical protein